VTFQVMFPPKTLLQPACSHSHPSHNRATSQIQAALLDPNSHFEKAGSSMYTGALAARPPALLAKARRASFLRIERRSAARHLRS